MQKIKFLTLAFFILLSTSCSVFTPVKTRTQTTYVLNNVPSMPWKKSARAVTLLVTPTTAAVPYATTQIAYTTQPYEIAYFATHRWAERPSLLFNSLIVQTLQQAHYFHAIVTPPVSGQYDYILNTHLQVLLQDYSKQPGILYFTVHAEIIKVATAKVIATRQFSSRKIIPNVTPYSGVVTANVVSSEILQQLANFCLQVI